jgi:hypothetical protein
MPETSGSGRRLFRRFALGSGPLKRGTDRLQFVARVLLLVTVLTAIPVALAVMTANYSQRLTVVAAEAAERHHVTATLLVDAAPARDAVSPDAATATVTWTPPSGVAREDVLTVPQDAKAGSTVRIWIDDRGDLTRRPATSGDVAAEAFGLGLLTFMAIVLVAATTFLIFRRLQDRGRLRRWAADWAVVEPVWTRKVP